MTELMISGLDCVSKSQKIAKFVSNSQAWHSIFTDRMKMAAQSQSLCYMCEYLKSSSPPLLPTFCLTHLHAGSGFSVRRRGNSGWSTLCINNLSGFTGSNPPERWKTFVLNKNEAYIVSTFEVPAACFYMLDRNPVQPEVTMITCLLNSHALKMLGPHKVIHN